MLRHVVPVAALMAMLLAAPGSVPIAHAQTATAQAAGAPASRSQQVQPVVTYSAPELVAAGTEFFGETSGELAQLIQVIFSKFGQPNGYILGEEASGALIGGVRYGEGVLNTTQLGRHKLFWQGPSIGWDFGGSGSRVMMLVYNLPDASRIMGRFGGVEGSAYAIGGLAMTVLVAGDVIVVPVRTGVGARLGINVGYLKFTPQPTWNPF
ncbi:DUF1134 domain-containing protein [Acuticoccus yangtzensis]|uniref:DUF1134 domain-containing protein n=1 Tax=Acuticoccus yangtzensis TaxID=1443441 RepID=UPI000A857642|nr:DUF1134 domain-containing protein [Acuticoccus yangtzensis]